MTLARSQGSTRYPARDPAGAGGQPVPVRQRGSDPACTCSPLARRTLLAAGCPGRCWTGSTCRSAAAGRRGRPARTSRAAGVVGAGAQAGRGGPGGGRRALGRARLQRQRPGARRACCAARRSGCRARRPRELADRRGPRARCRPAATTGCCACAWTIVDLDGRTAPGRRTTWARRWSCAPARRRERPMPRPERRRGWPASRSAHLVEPGNRDLGELVRAVGPGRGAGPPARRRRARSRCARRSRARLGARRPAATWPSGRWSAPTGSACGIVTPGGRRVAAPAAGPGRGSAGDGRTRSTATPIRRTASGCAAPWPLAEACERSVAVVGARASTRVRRARRRRPRLRAGRPGLDGRLRRRVRHRRGRPPGRAGRRRAARSRCSRAASTGRTRSATPRCSTASPRAAWCSASGRPGADPHRQRFLIRNRVIAAATRAR